MITVEERSLRHFACRKDFIDAPELLLACRSTRCTLSLRTNRSIAGRHVENFLLTLFETVLLWVLVRLRQNTDLSSRIPLLFDVSRDPRSVRHTHCLGSSQLMLSIRLPLPHTDSKTILGVFDLCSCESLHSFGDHSLSSNMAILDTPQTRQARTHLPPRSPTPRSR